MKEKLRKPSFLFAGLLLLSACHAGRKAKESPAGARLVQEYADIQRWAGGAAGSGRGTQYRIRFGITAADSVVIDQVYLGDTVSGADLSYRLYSDSLHTRLHSPAFPPGLRTGWMQARHTIPGAAAGEAMDTQPAPVPAPRPLPAGFRQGLLVRYHVGQGQPQILEIRDMKVLPPLLYP